ncbi:NAD(P)-dependent dehydrogenase (short-subunit alcohol dehydrogenase family) [Oceanobacillus polygoni]|uniref:NAD(P)-dependent dehydrogenase (Short-subunit alcohol dehydrogenase family) n=1 Tax=Oceanobacillus polygoni TaxID=1235259 RepID=A0A9X0YS56_9BACI|nr:NAD(P)-dependent dehydrogenase (short-subunit alcohol dehydrogenase family) [Oceanobacillus polygoni]
MDRLKNKVAIVTGGASGMGKSESSRFASEGAKVVVADLNLEGGLVAQKGGAAYTAAKHGVVGYTKHLAAVYSSKGIKVNAIAPGTIQTPITEE